MRRVGLPPGGSTLTTSAPKPASASPQYSACSSASSTTRRPVSAPGRGVLWLEIERSSCASMVTLQICARQWTVYSCVGIVACFFPVSTRPDSFPPKLIRKLAHSESKILRAIPLQEHLIVRIDEKCWTRCPTGQYQRRRLDLSR